MKALVYRQFGPPEVIKIEDVPTPEPKEGEILVRVHASTITAVDTFFRMGKPFSARLAAGLTKPKIHTQGTEFSGVVEKVGEGVTRFKVGDKVMGEPGPNFGAHAEYVVIGQDGVILHKPESLNFHEAAALPAGALTALPFLRDTGRLEAGQKLLVIGASGSVGSFGVQFGKYLGAEVTGVCSGRNVELVTSLGADHVVDYNLEDFTKNGLKYDVIFDAIGASSFGTCRGSLTSRGVYMSTTISFSILFNHLLTAKSSGQRGLISFTGLRAKEEKKKDLELIHALAEEGRIKPYIDKVFPMGDAVAAHAYVDKGRKRGNVVVSFV
ncbi:NAD(P)-dependent alcohol dehydrogenase [bacterium]|nr:NAD(P)-dependent alcohol dehydrogenase [bacterium]